MESLKRQRDPLTAADAQRHQSAPDTVSVHRVKEAGRQHGSCRTDRMAMCDGAALDIDDVLGEPEFPDERQDDRREGLVDLHALDVAERPTSAIQGLPHRGNRPETEQAGFDRADPEGHKTGHRRQAMLLGPAGIRNDHARGAAVEARCIAGGNGSSLAESRLQLGQRLQRCVRAVVLILVEDRRPLATGDFDRRDLGIEHAGRLRRAKALLRPLRPAVLRLARHLKLADEVLGHQARVVIGEGVVEAVAQLMKPYILDARDEVVRKRA